MNTVDALSGGALDTLVKLVEFGPQESGGIPSKSGLLMLLDAGFAVQTVAADGEWHFSARVAGAEAYVTLFGGANLREAKEARQAHSRLYDGPVGEIRFSPSVAAEIAKNSPATLTPIVPLKGVLQMAEITDGVTIAEIDSWIDQAIKLHPPVDTLSLAEGVPCQPSNKSE